MAQNKIKKIDLNLIRLENIVHPQKIELFGRSNLGTTALSLYISRQFALNGLFTLYIDVSRRLTKQYLIQNKHFEDEYLTILQANKTTEIYNAIDNFRNSVDLIIIDDITTISTTEMYKSKHKELISNLIDYINRETINNTVIFINQIRINIINNSIYSPYGYLQNVDMRIYLQLLEERKNYKIVQGKILLNNFGNEDYFSFKLFQDRLEGKIEE